MSMARNCLERMESVPRGQRSLEEGSAFQERRCFEKGINSSKIESRRRGNQLLMTKEPSGRDRFLKGKGGQGVPREAISSSMGKGGSRRESVPRRDKAPR